MTDDDQTNNPASSERDSALERSSDRGGERELSNGKRDRSRDMLREELTRNLDDAARRSGRPRDWNRPTARHVKRARPQRQRPKTATRAPALAVQQHPAVLMLRRIFHPRLRA
jgi:hypothetical protein